ncbi:hypothetical protein CA13_59200 [Planctomycetes bacterium CA13]|uniref:Uncharacterized protein n=1 Tax=Novipirellula herctigrandis TaxID=2527986 RepID=A0A5C5ZAW6_9BACT|nr:hypothetical protein CA13_59200 [Planctomycetes bacterium CA13]
MICSNGLRQFGYPNRHLRRLTFVPIAVFQSRCSNRGNVDSTSAYIPVSLLNRKLQVHCDATCPVGFGATGFSIDWETPSFAARPLWIERFVDPISNDAEWRTHIIRGRLAFSYRLVSRRQVSQLSMASARGECRAHESKTRSKIPRKTAHLPKWIHELRIGPTASSKMY